MEESSVAVGTMAGVSAEILEGGDPAWEAVAWDPEGGFG